MKEGDYWTAHQEGGKTFLRLKKKPVVLEQPIRTDGSYAHVKISGDIRISGLETDGRWGAPMLGVQFLDKEGNNIKDAGTMRFLRRDQDWTELTLKTSVPLDAYTIVPVLQFGASAGQADFANIRLEVTELREAPDRASGADMNLSGDVEDALAKIEYHEHHDYHKEARHKAMSEWRARVDPAAYETTLYVDAGVSGGDGSEARPFGSIKKALEEAKNLIYEGSPTRVFIRDGEYREHYLSIDAKKLGGKATETLLVIEGESRDGVRIKGSGTEEFQPEKWELIDADRNIYRIDWTKTDLRPVPAEAWSPAMNAISRHYVTVFVNGGWLKPVQLELFEQEKLKEEKYEREHGGISTRRQVVDHFRGYAGLDAMEPGTLAVNTLGPGELGFDNNPHPHPNSLLIRLPEGLDFEKASVEASWGQRAGFRFKNKSNLVVRNLTVEHMGIAAFYAGHGEDILLENFTARHNDGGGGASAVRFRVCKHITFRNSAVVNNGTYGLGMTVKYGRIDNVDIIGNNWRGGLSGHVMHGQGGFGGAWTHLLIRDSRFNDNYGHGLRQDELGEHIVIENSEFNGNLASGGMMWEISYGPLEIRDTEVIGNNGYGIYLLCMHGVTLDGVDIINNRDSQLSIYPMLNRGKQIWNGSPRFSGPRRWPKGAEEDVRGFWIEGNLNMTMRDCVIAVTNPMYSNQPLIVGRYWKKSYHYMIDWLKNQLTSEGNIFWNAGSKQVFDIGQSGGAQGGNYATFERWQEVTGQDQNSEWDTPEGDFPAPAVPMVQAADIPEHRR